MGTTASENFGKLSHYPHGADFFGLLRWHFKWGTRAELDPDKVGVPWTADSFSGACQAFGSKAMVEAKTVYGWLQDGIRPYPKNLGTIISILFGDASAYDSWRTELLRAYGDIPARGRARQSSKIKDFPTPKSIPSSTELTPDVPSYFIGRNSEVEALVKAVLSVHRSVILIQGGPGIGKTELTKAIASQAGLIEKFEGRRWFVALDTVNDPQAMLVVISRTVGTATSLGLDGIMARLRAEPSLLVLDNLETPWEPASHRKAVEKILAALQSLPTLTLIASIRGSRIPEGADWTDVHDVAPLKTADSMALFSRLAHFDNTTDKYFRRFTKALGGVPLAIILVALRARGSASLARLWTEWERIGTELAIKPLEETSRHSSLTASIKLSLNSPTVTEQAKRLFAILGRLPDGISEEERNALVGDDSFECERTLLDVGLALERNERVNLLPPIREYAERLELDENDHTLWADVALAPLYKIEALTAHQYEQQTRLFHGISQSIANIESALASLLAQNANDKLTSILNPLVNVALKHRLSINIVLKIDDYIGRIDQRPEHYQAHLLVAVMAERARHFDLANASYKLAILKLESYGDDLALANAHLLYGEFQNRNDRHRGRENLVEAQRLAKRSLNNLGEMDASLALASASFMDTSWNTARETVERCAAYYNENGLWLKSAECSEMLAEIYAALLAYDAAIDHIDFALSTWEENGFAKNIADCLVKKAEILSAKPEPELSLACVKRAMETYRELGDEKGIADCFYRRGVIAYHHQLDSNFARGEMQAAEEIFQRLGNDQGIGKCLYFRSTMINGLQEPIAYRELIEAASGHFHLAMSACDKAQCIHDLGRLAYQQGRLEEAIWKAVEAVKIFDQRCDHLGWMNSTLLMAEIMSTCEEFQKAEISASGVLDTARELGSDIHEARALNLLGDICSNLQRHAEARGAWQQAAAIFSKLGMIADEQACHDKQVL